MKCLEILVLISYRSYGRIWDSKCFLSVYNEVIGLRVLFVVERRILGKGEDLRREDEEI